MSSGDVRKLGLRILVTGFPLLTLVGCNGASATPIPQETMSAPILSPTPAFRPSSTPTPPEPTVSVPPFTGDPHQLCQDAQPADVYQVSNAFSAPEKQLAYLNILIELVEFRNPDGVVGAVPPNADGRYAQLIWAGGAATSSRLDFLPGPVDLLACVDMRAGTPTAYTYTGSRGATALAPADTIVWMVDAASGSRVGGAWVEEPYMGILYIDSARVLSVDEEWAIPGDGTYPGSIVLPEIAADIFQFLGVTCSTC
jgi:hypothetical protein